MLVIKRIMSGEDSAAPKQMKRLFRIRAAVVSDAEAIASIFYSTIRRVNIQDYKTHQIEA